MLFNETRLNHLKSFLNLLVNEVETEEYIADDPVSFMHRYDEIEDRNLAGFLSALLAWGRRSIVMAKIDNLLGRFNSNPAEFIGNFSHLDKYRLEGFKHRTFTEEDLEWILQGLSQILIHYGTFEKFWTDCYSSTHQYSENPDSVISIHHSIPVFKSSYSGKSSRNITTAQLLLDEFHNRFFQLIPEAPNRVRKHIPKPAKNSSCKRLCLYLKWTIRRGSCVDPGTMQFMPPSELMIPLDVHVAHYSRKLGLLTRRSNDWKAVCELTGRLRSMDPEDPVKYDFALFGLGIHSAPIPDELVRSDKYRP